MTPYLSVGLIALLALPLCFYDIRDTLLPLPLTMALLLSGLLQPPYSPTLAHVLLVGCIGVGLVTLLRLATKRDVLGLGDVLICMGITAHWGLIVCWLGILHAIYIACLYSVYWLYRINSRSGSLVIPFAPALFIGSFLAYYEVPTIPHIFYRMLS